jgi:hypothetical protein
VSRLILILAFCLGGSLARAQVPMDPSIVGDKSNHWLSWNTSLNYFYQVDCSIDLQTWVWTNLEVDGTGSRETYGFMSNADKLFYRIRANTDPNNGGFLVLPEDNDEVDLIDGVCFAFDLNQFANLPAKIRIFQRAYDSGDHWEQIGLITDFDEIDDIKFVRGSVVWLPEEPGDYEVQATAVDGAGGVMASAIRNVSVGSNQAPTITITSGPTSPSATAQPAVFTATVEDDDGDNVRRVEFYDNGILIGTDTTPTATGNPDVFEFGDNIVDREGVSYDLLRLDDDSGTPEDESIHQITARAFDSRGAIGETATFFPVDITGTTVNARPEIEVTNVPNGRLVVGQGPNAFTIDYDATDADGLSDIAGVEAYDILEGAFGDHLSTSPTGSLVFDTSLWDFGTYTLRVVARDQASDESYPLYIEVYVSSGLAETLAANVVDGVTATIVEDSERFVGVEESSGVFTDGEDSGLEFDSGALLSTGAFANWNTGNRDDGGSFDVLWNSAGDQELEDRVAGRVTNDAAALEFDVYCANSQLEIEFQFGSEEYLEYVAEDAETGCYNDAFMLTVDGVFVSLVPDCSDIVAVNSVHPAIPWEDSDCLPVDVDLDEKNEFLFLGEEDLDDAIDPQNSSIRVEYDGMTIRLRAHAFVTPGESHHIRLVIADVDDAQWDSGLFIRESSIRTIVPTP